MWVESSREVLPPVRCIGAEWSCYSVWTVSLSLELLTELWLCGEPSEVGTYTSG